MITAATTGILLDLKLRLKNINENKDDNDDDDNVATTIMTVNK